MSAPQGHAIVTGGSSGIGAGLVARLVRRGLSVTVFDLNPPPEQPGVAYEKVDVTNEASVRGAMQSAVERFGAPIGLVTCHGVRGQFVPADELDLDVVRRVLDIHVVGTLAVAREFATVAESAAAVVTVSSTTAYGGWANQSDYGVAKAAIRQLTANLAIEWASRGIRVNSVAPGHTLTPMVQEMIDQGYDVSATKARTPLGRLSTPDEMAASMEYLLLDAPFVTGQCLAVDGGWTAVGK